MSGGATKHVLAFAAVLALYLTHASALSGWIVDDAGISFAYSRSLAQGHGLVSQPGADPVEGYSNPLWVFILAPFFRAGTFDADVTPKLISLILVIGCIALLMTRVTRATRSPGVAITAVALISMNSSFVIWTASGLENPVLAFLAALLVVLLSRDAGSERSALLQPVLMALVAFLLSITRPDGLVYAGAFPLMHCLLAYVARDRRRLLTRSIVSYFLVFAAAYGIWLIARYAYFHDWVPNTFHAKGRGMTQLSLHAMRQKAENLFSLIWSLGGPASIVAAAWMTYAVVKRTYRKQITRLELALVSTLSMALIAFVVLPADWMGEYRFATGFIVLFYPALIVLLWGEYGDWAKRQHVRRARVVAVSAVVAGMLIAFFGMRTSRFVQDPTISLESVREDWAEPYNTLTREFEIRNASALIPDLGGTLYYGDFRIYDLAMLCDRTIAQLIGGALYEDRDPKKTERFYDYVFEDIKPTFIRTHSVWSDLTRLWLDPRFHEDYTVIHYRAVPPPDQWVGPRHEYDVVRKDAIQGREDEFVRRYKELIPYLESTAESDSDKRGLHTS